MRQVFTSARLENVEHVAKLLEDAGIEVRVTNGRSYKGAIRGNFTYRDEGGQKPAVWIVKSEDQPRARSMLREAGLMDSSRNAPESYLAMSFRGTNPDPHTGNDAQRRAFRIKLGLLVVIAAIVVLAFTTMRGPSTSVPAGKAKPSATVATAAIPVDLTGRGTRDTPDSLAAAVLRGELPTRADGIVCIAVDGHDAPATLLAALPPSPGQVLPLSRCPAHAVGTAPAAQMLAIGKYDAGASGAGSIFLQRRRVGGRAVPQWYTVRRDGDGWRVLQPL
jgi:hypothetical protein